jgi:DNA-binding transcriptional MerR regulator
MYNNSMQAYLTIGKLAQKVGLRPSALRYYEEQGLIQPVERSQSGYRLYAPAAEQTLRFIQRAQRLGFSLTDIRNLLVDWKSGQLRDDTVLQIAQRRYFELERQMTQSLVLQHELGLFLQDLREAQNHASLWGDTLNEFLERVCNNPLSQPDNDTFEWLLAQSGCSLTTAQGRELLQALRGQHTHIWQQDDRFHILIVSQDEKIGRALQQLAALEENCTLHADQRTVPQFYSDDEGFLLLVQGENAFIFVRLFLMLEEMGR